MVTQMDGFIHERSLCRQLNRKDANFYTMYKTVFIWAHSFTKQDLCGLSGLTRPIFRGILI